MRYSELTVVIISFKFIYSNEKTSKNNEYVAVVVVVEEEVVVVVEEQVVVVVKVEIIVVYNIDLYTYIRFFQLGAPGQHLLQPRGWLIWCQRTGWSPSCCESRKVKSNETGVLWTSTPMRHGHVAIYQYNTVTSLNLEAGRSWAKFSLTCWEDCSQSFYPDAVVDKSHHRYPPHQNPMPDARKNNQNTKNIYNKSNLDMNQTFHQYTSEN